LRRRVDHVSVGVEHTLTREQRRRGQKASVSAHRVLHLEPVAAADDVVVQAVARRGVHGARARIERDVIAQDHRNAASVERMLQLELLEHGPFGLGEHGPTGNAESLHQGFDAFGREHQPLAAVVQVELDQRIIELRMHRHRLIRRQRPRGGGPDGDGSGHALVDLAALRDHAETPR
jgi:hypothetical protein